MPDLTMSDGRNARIDGAEKIGVRGDVIRGDQGGRADHRAQAALASSSVVELRDLTVCCEGEQLLISGRVQCFYHKQLAQETVRQHAADLRLVNQVSVTPIATPVV